MYAHPFIWTYLCNPSIIKQLCPAPATIYHLGSGKRFATMNASETHETLLLLHVGECVVVRFSNPTSQWTAGTVAGFRHGRARSPPCCVLNHFAVRGFSWSFLARANVSGTWFSFIRVFAPKFNSVARCLR